MIKVICFVAMLQFFLINQKQKEYCFSSKRELPLPQGSHLSIQNEVGTITVQSHPFQKLIVESKKIVKVKEGISEEKAEEYARTIQIDISQQDRATTISTKLLKIHDENVKRRAVDYKIFIPKEISKINIRGGVGDVKLTNIEGAADIKVGVGGFFCEKIQGEVKVKVETGDVKIVHFIGILDIETGVGSISCKDVQAEKLKAKIEVGDVSLTNVTGSGEIETGIGKVLCEKVQKEKLKIKTGIIGEVKFR